MLVPWYDMPEAVEAIEAVYEQHFGPITKALPERFFGEERPGLDDDEAIDAAPVFYGISCWDGGTPGARAMYGSLGAVNLPAAHELFLVASAPFGGCLDLVSHVIEARTTPLRPLEVIPCELAHTPFEAILVAPVGDGLALPPVDGTVRHALRAIPLTRAERGLAEDAPAQALALLRAAGAFVVHPLRDCLLEPERTRAGRGKLEAELYATAGRWYHTAVESLGRLREMDARDRRELRAALDAHRGDREAEARAREDYARCKMPAQMLADAEQMVTERRAILLHLDAPGGPPAADRHVPYPLHRAVPPDAARVARRARVHAAVVRRWQVENGALEGEEQARRLLAGRVRKAGLRAELSPAEAALLDAPFGSLTDRDFSWAGHHGQSLLVFSWALHLSELPRHDELGFLLDLFPALGSGPPGLASPRLRSLEERVAYLNLVHALHWRLYMLDESPGPIDVLAAAKSEGFWFGSLSFDGIPLVSGDVAVDGRPIHEAPPERVRQIAGATFGRLRAASWLAGLHPLYAEAPVSFY